MKSFLSSALVSLLLLLLGGTPTAVSRQAEEQPPPKGYRFETKVQIIPVPVFVTDEKGDPVVGLTSEDFTVKEDGKSRPIVIFEPISYDRLSTFKDRMPLHPALRRSFLLFFDLLFSTPRGILRAREAALDFVRNRLTPADLVAVATYSHIGGLKILCNFTADHRQAEQAVDTLGLVQSTDVIQDPVGFVFSTLLEKKEGPGTAAVARDEKEEQITDAMLWLKNRLDRSERDRYSNQAASYLDSFNELYTAMRSVSGRKIVLVLSQGIDSNFVTGTGITEMDSDFQKFQQGNVHLIASDTRFGRTELRDALIAGLRRATGADVMVNTFDVSGLGGDAGAPPGRGAGGGQDTLFMMANETGGHFFSNINDLEGPLQRILKETSHFYLLGFNPRDLKRKGRFHRIEVDVKREDVKVSARRGYYEPKPPDQLTPSERRLEISEFVSKDLLSDDVTFDVLLSVYPAQPNMVRVPVFLKFPGRQFLEGKRPSDVLQLEIYAYAIDGEGHFVDFFNRTLSLDVGKERDRLRRAGIKYYDLLLVRPGATRLKLIARDVEAGKIGSFIEDIEAPDFSGGDLALAPPVFITAEPEWIVARGVDPDHIETRREGLPVSYPFVVEGNEYIPAVRPALRRDQPTNVMVRVYNLKLHPETGQPQTEMKFRRIAPQGDAETLHNVGLVSRPTQPYPGCFELVFQVQWGDTALGPALLELTLTDALTGETRQVSSPFVLIP